MEAAQMATVVQIDKLRIDGGTQPRVKMSNELVDEYSDLMKSGVKFPPVIAFDDGGELWLADGFHRVLAAQKANLTSIPANVFKGTPEDAVLFSCGANNDHGQRRTNADKKRAVETLLKHPVWTKWSDSEIGRKCGASHTFVAKERSILATLQVSTDQERSFTHPKTGQQTTMNTGNIGRQVMSKAEYEAGAEQAKDNFNNVLPKNVAADFARASELRQLSKQINDISSAVAQRVALKDKLFTKVVLASFQADLNNAKNALLAQIPYAKCPLCDGAGCKACVDRGWMSRLDYDVLVPQENKW
jgi:hypothetical protein